MFIDKKIWPPKTPFSWRSMKIVRKKFSKDYKINFYCIFILQFLENLAKIFLKRQLRSQTLGTSLQSFAPHQKFWRGKIGVGCIWGQCPFPVISTPWGTPAPFNVVLAFCRGNLRDHWYAIEPVCRAAHFKSSMGGLPQKMPINGGRPPMRNLIGANPKFSWRLRRRKTGYTYQSQSFLHFY